MCLTSTRQHLKWNWIWNHRKLFRACFSLAFLRVLIGLNMSRHIFIQSELKSKISGDLVTRIFPRLKRPAAWICFWFCDWLIWLVQLLWSWSFGTPLKLLFKIPSHLTVGFLLNCFCLQRRWLNFCLRLWRGALPAASLHTFQFFLPLIQQQCRPQVTTTATKNFFLTI